MNENKFAGSIEWDCQFETAMKIEYKFWSSNELRVELNKCFEYPSIYRMND